ncbi:homoserine dehydrogenase [Aestuariirhabdus litorea]|uniref:Homoserine dehydrogenase n=1 Tax=Aestuariirhabdus litorea TaxID=2528527 RepID=A0A3P3VTD9_9GAMM|nr:homoserine dehydrogenase [Aestuariirhabdus litorea]RRJ85228.1 homoserine dehydrogenase [Aestuariirhabdus litorea]RWW98449.1 homoserine dehydrogenase [Endozoicomonadaceae bacterium GTF-13]
MKPIRVGICGLGTVGGGTFNLLTGNAEEIRRRLGREIRVEMIAARRTNPACDTSGIRTTADIFDVARDPEVDLVVELIGGYDTARELVLTAIDHGKHVVTANKALIAVHGNEIFEAAAAKGVNVAYEAGVAGGIPVIKAIREGLAANRINTVAGIINGTGNFILSEMREKGRDFADVLAEAQALGYAEADPTFDVEGIDAAHKLTILASIAFGMPLQFDKAYTEGISEVTPEDLKYAQELGYRIKHLGIARRRTNGVELRVHPTLIPESRLIANVNGVMNAVMVAGDAVGPTMYYGAGAGAAPTASAVVADIMDLARSFEHPACAVAALGYAPGELQPLPVLAVDQVESAYYLRLDASDKPGVMTTITGVLSQAGINIEAILQKEVRSDEQVAHIIMLTHSVQESQMNSAITSLEGLEVVTGKVTRIRMDHLN